MAPRSGVYHLVKDERDPTWDSWDEYNEAGNCTGNYDSLRQARCISEVPQLHRGLHPDPTRRTGVVFVPEDCIYPGFYRVYWYEL